MSLPKEECEILTTRWILWQPTCKACSCPHRKLKFFSHEKFECSKNSKKKNEIIYFNVFYMKFYEIFVNFTKIYFSRTCVLIDFSIILSKTKISMCKMLKLNESCSPSLKFFNKEVRNKSTCMQQLWWWNFYHFNALMSDELYNNFMTDVNFHVGNDGMTNFTHSLSLKVLRMEKFVLRNMTIWQTFHANLDDQILKQEFVRFKSENLSQGLMT